MSYVVNIWENPIDRSLPENIQDAIAVLDELHQIQPGQNPKFLLLAERLTQRYPCSSVVLDEDDDEEPDPSDFAWSDSPMDGRTVNAVFNLGFNGEMIGETRPFVIEQLAKLGLCMMDGQAGEVYLPDGRILVAPHLNRSLPAAESNYEDVPKRKDMAKLAFERLGPFLANYGFKPRKKDLSFTREFVCGNQEITIDADVDRWPNHAEFEVQGYVNFFTVTDFAGKVKGRFVEDFNTAVTLQRNWMKEGKVLPFFDNYPHKYIIKSYSEVDAVMAHLFEKLAGQLLPILDKCRTIEGLDELMNPESPTQSQFIRIGEGQYNLAVAYLANNTRLQQICDEVLKISLIREKVTFRNNARCFVDYINSNPLKTG